jgi:hypothetical protein
LGEKEKGRKEKKEKEGREFFHSSSICAANIQSEKAFVKRQDKKMLPA